VNRRNGKPKQTARGTNMIDINQLMFEVMMDRALDDAEITGRLYSVYSNFHGDWIVRN